MSRGVNPRPIRVTDVPLARQNDTGAVCPTAPEQSENDTHCTHTQVGVVRTLERRGKVLQAEGTGRIARFGAFELDRQTGELRKHGIRVRLQGKPFQILVALLERPGETVSRDELRQRLWSGDTFVDFESGLNTAANRLRIALGDSADNPRYIETLARSGYRFIAPVEEVLPVTSEPESLEATDAPIPPVAVKTQRSSRRWLIAAIALGALAMGMAAERIISAFRHGSEVTMHQITFRRGAVWSARFAPDGSVVYSGKWTSSPKQVYLASVLSPESRSLGFESSSLASVSRSGELALLQTSPARRTDMPVLSRVPVNGGAPLPVAKSVAYADWSPDGNQLAIIRHTESQDSIEYPIGKALYKSWGLLSDLRFSPSGDALAFFEHPYRADDGGTLKIIDLAGHVSTLGPAWASAGGVAWAPSGTEIYFTATPKGSARTLHAVSRSGRLRDVAKVPGALVIYDISHDGKLLVSRENKNLIMEGWNGDDQKTRDLSWFDWSNVVAGSDDLDLVLFDESGEGGGPEYSTYLHRVSTGETTRLGPGRAMALAPDGRSAITMQNNNYKALQVVPVGPGQVKVIDGHGISYQAVRYLPDGQSIVFVGREQDEPPRIYVQNLNGSEPKRLPVDVQPYWLVVSPDGKSIASRTTDGRLVIQALAGGQPRVVQTAGLVIPIRWTTEPNEMYVFCVDSGVMNEISKVNLTTGECTPFHQIVPAEGDPSTKVSHVIMAADGKSVVYSYHRVFSELYVVNGW